jgi:hypothetical protein
MIVLIITAIVLFIVFIRTHSRHRRPGFAAVANMALGVGALVLFAPLTSASVNLLTVFAALTLGLPGVALVLLGSVVL